MEGYNPATQDSLFRLPKKSTWSTKKVTSSTQIVSQSSPEQMKLLSEVSNPLPTETSEVGYMQQYSGKEDRSLGIIDTAVSNILPSYLFAATDCRPETRVEGDRKGYERLQTQMNKTTHGIFQKISDTLLTDPDLGMVYKEPVGSLAGQMFDANRLKPRNLYVDLIRQGRSVELNLEVLKQTLDTKMKSSTDHFASLIPYVSA